LERFEDDRDHEPRAVDWALWLEHWMPLNGYSPLIDIACCLDDDLFASYGARLGITLGREEDGTVTGRALLWFLLCAIRGWAERGDDLEEIKPGARWLLEVHRGERAQADPIAALLAYSYDRFRAGGYAPTVPLPAVLTIEQPLMVQGVKSRRAA
jgi:hypothetical protein